jgi:type II restriction/modification system DNA methylase subunit YeeA
MNEKYTFKNYLGRNWWFLLLAFSKLFIQSEKESAFGSLFLDTLFFGGILLAIMFAYWFIRYGRKQNK